MFSSRNQRMGTHLLSWVRSKQLLSLAGERKSIYSPQIRFCQREIRAFPIRTVEVSMKTRYKEIQNTTIKPNLQSYPVDTENSFRGGKAAGE